MKYARISTGDINSVTYSESQKPALVSFSGFGVLAPLLIGGKFHYDLLTTLTLLGNCALITEPKMDNYSPFSQSF